MDPIKSLSAALPQQLTLKAVNRIHNHYSDPNDPNDTSYVDLVIEDGGVLNGTFDGFCIDSDRAIDFGVDENFNGQIDANTNEVGGSYTAKVYSSYDPLPDELVGQGLIEKPENLDLLNWIINQDFTFQTSPSGGNYTWADIQRAIWTLIDDENSTAGGVGEEGQYWEQERVDEIVAAARANGEGFVPTYGQKVGVIIVPDNDGDGAPDAQIQFAAVDLKGLGDYVFYDSNANGVQDADEFGAGDVVVKLLNADGSAVVDGNGNPITTTTDGNGAYSFTVPAGEYKVMFIPPAGFTFTNANVGNDDTLDSDANPFNGMTQTIVMAADDVFNGTLDAGLVRSAGLGNFVFEDTNANGEQDAGEQGIAGVEVKLLADTDNDGQVDDVVKTTTTDADGFYEFTGLTQGDYRVMFTQPDGFDSVSPFQAGFDNSLDSDANPDNNLVSNVVTLAPGDFDERLDAGFYQRTPGLGDFVFFDDNANGIQDADEAGVEGVVVKLLNPDGSAALDNDGNPITTTTDNQGAYAFFNLTPGEYQVMFVAPEGFVFTTANAGGDDALDSDAGRNGITQTVFIQDGDFNDTLDAGIVRPAGLGNFVFEDTNADGIQDAGEQGIAGVEVKLLADTDNDGQVDDVLDTTTTDGNGFYEFTGLTQGDYRVMFTQPDGFDGVSPFQAGFDSSFDSDAGAGLMSNVITLAPGDFDDRLDAGFFKSAIASLGDRVWYDTDGDGIQDTGEQGVEGVKVTLTGGGADGVIGTGNDDTTTETITDANGNYRFDELNPGEEYKVTFGLPQAKGITNLVQNGSFERNNTAQNRWRVESGLDGWQVTQGRGIEVQELYQYFGAGDEGQSWVEMDGYENTGIRQEIDTQTGQTYELSFAYAGRPGVSAGSNTIEVYWNGELIDTISESGIGHRESRWKTYTYEVEGSDQATTGLEFRGAGRSDGLGAFLDDVQLVTCDSHEHPTQRQVGNELKGGGVTDGWRSNMVVNEADIYTNQSGLTQTIDLSSFNFNAGKTGAPVTPFVALVNGDNDFTVLEVGTTRTNYQLGQNSFAFADGRTPSVTLEAGQKLAIGFIDANADGSGSQHSAIRFTYGGDEIWYSGGWHAHHAGGVEIGSSPRAGYRTLTHLKRDYQFGIEFDVETESTFEFTQQNIGNDALDSDANLTNGMSQIVTLQPGEHNSTIDAGIVEKLGTVGGQVWHDRHRNDGIQNTADLNYEAGGFSNVLVNLFTQSGELMDSTLTGTSGFYNFDNVKAGSYYVEFDASTNLTTKARLDGTAQFSGVAGQRGWSFTSVFNAGTDDARDSDIISGTSTKVAQRTGVFNLNAGEINNTIGTALTPIAFDLNGDGIQTLSIDEGVMFDMRNTGTAINTGWLSGEDAFLAIDNNGDGLISSRAELFGGATVGAGFAKLESFDSNGDGLVNEADDMFTEIRLWQDSNENGFTDEGELTSLTSAGITDLSTDYTNVFSADAQGNVHGEHSTAKRHGSTIDMVDVYFQVAG